MEHRGDERVSDPGAGEASGGELSDPDGRETSGPEVCEGPDDHSGHDGAGVHSGEAPGRR